MLLSFLFERFYLIFFSFDKSVSGALCCDLSLVDIVSHLLIDLFVDHLELLIHLIEKLLVVLIRLSHPVFHLYEGAYHILSQCLILVLFAFRLHLCILCFTLSFLLRCRGTFSLSS